MFEVGIEENAFTYLYMMKSLQKSLNILLHFFYFFFQIYFMQTRPVGLL